MRSMMRSTAESHGKQTVRRGNDSVEVWHRDPLVAEAMVDPRTVVPGLIDSTKVLTFTVAEAIANGYCEGKAETIDDVIEIAGLSPANIMEYKPSWLDSMILFLMNPFLQGLLLMLIIGGIYFELQSPGIGFPLAAAVTGALLYFAPLYLEGLAENWELLLFVAGLILLGVEIFVIPGFGVAGVAGIVCCITGLMLSMVDNNLFSSPEGINLTPLVRPLFVVTVGVFGGLIGSIYLTRKLYPTKLFGRIALKTDLTENTGYVGVPVGLSKLIGETGVAHTSLRPSGKVEVNGDIYDAIAEHGMIEKGKKIKIINYETGQLYCSIID
jgi:membrane-bound serine protease (ClpP class)